MASTQSIVARQSAKEAAQVARMMGAVVKGGGSIDYWKMEAAKQSAQLEAAESAAALCSQLAVVNTGDIEPVDRMRVIIAMLTGNLREECISTWSRRVRDHAIRKAGRIDSRMHQVSLIYEI